MVSNAKLFCKTCEECQQCKGNTKLTPGKLHMLPIPMKLWDSIRMDFVGPFPEVVSDNGRKFNYLWVIVCHMMSIVHFILVHTTMTAHQLSGVYMQEIICLHRLPCSIVSDRDPKFTSKWWRELHKMVGSQLLMSTSFHPQTDGMTEWINWSIGQTFCTRLHPNQRDWYGKVELTEFAINASMSDTTKFAPFELNGRYMPSMIHEIRHTEQIILGIWAFTETVLLNLASTHNTIIEAQAFQTSRTNKKQGRSLV